MDILNIPQVAADLDQYLSRFDHCLQHLSETNFDNGNDQPSNLMVQNFIRDRRIAVLRIQSTLDVIKEAIDEQSRVTVQ